MTRDGQLVVQSYIDNPERYIWRVDIVGGKVIVCNRRYAYTHLSEVAICNGTHGGAVEFLSSDEFSAPACTYALQAVAALELDVAGVDIIADANDNLYILEVNPEPDITLNRYEFTHAIADHLIECASISSPHVVTDT